MTKELNLNNSANNSNAAFTSGNDTATITVNQVEVDKLFESIRQLGGEDAIFYTHEALARSGNEDRQLAMDAVLDFYASVRNLVYEIEFIFSENLLK